MGLSVTIGGRVLGDVGSPRVLASSLQVTADDAAGIAGPSSAAFTIVWDPRDETPDFRPYAPVTISIDSIPVFAGYVWTSTRVLRSLNVQCNGRKTLLDNAMLSLSPLDADMSTWMDRQALGQAFSGDTYHEPDWAPGLGLVQASPQGIALTYPLSPAGWSNSNVYCVTAIREIPYAALGLLIGCSFSGSIGGSLYCWSDTRVANTGHALSFNIPDTSNAGVYSGSCPAGNYLKLAFGFSSSTTIAVTQVCIVTLVWLFDGGAVAPVHASDVALRLPALIPSFSSDTSQIKPTATQLAHAAWPDPGSPAKDILAQISSYDDPLVGVDAQSRLVLQPRSTLPAVELTADAIPTSEAPSDPSSLVSDVVVEGPAPSGQQVARRYNHLDLPELPRIPAVGAAVVNGLFSGSTAGWSVGSGSTLTYGASGAPGPTGSYAVWSSSAGGVVPASTLMWNALSGQFLAGQPYLMQFYAGDTLALPPAKTGFAAPSIAVWIMDTGDNEGLVQRQIRLPVSVFQQFSITWIPRRTSSTVWLIFINNVASPQVYPVDGRIAYNASKPALAAVTLSQLAQPGPLAAARVTVTARQSIPLMSNDQAGLAVGQAYLRGSIRQGPTAVRVAGAQGARDPVSGVPRDPASLLAVVGQKVRLADRVDPATGQIAPSLYCSQVAYDHGSRKATVTMGSRYAAFDELLAQMGG